MFDFFRDLYYEARGIDSDAASVERKLNLEEKKKSRFIFSKGGKILVFFLGILYLLVGWLDISVLRKTGSLTAYNLIRILFLSGFDIACLVCLAVGKKKSEIAALVLIILFFVVLYITRIIV